jgi:hypothetical protein
MVKKGCGGDKSRLYVVHADHESAAFCFCRKDRVNIDIINPYNLHLGK